MMHRYAEWCRKRANTAQCSPALAVAGVILAIGITCYIYRTVIETTVITALIACVAVAATCGVLAIVVSTVRYFRAARIVALERAPVPDTWTKDDEPARVTDEDVAAISREADWLASGVELAFSPDGKTLKAKG